MNTGGISNRCSRYVIAYLAEARNHHSLLGSQTKNWQKISTIFFITKITNIRLNLTEQNAGSSDIQTEHCTIPSILENYRLLDCDEVAKIVLASPTKTCEADPVPTELLKKVVPAIIQLLTKLVNESL